MHGCLYFSRSGMAGRRRDAFFCFILLGIAAPFVIQCAAEGIIRCRTNVFLNENRTLLPLENIYLSYTAESDQFRDIVDQPWCSNFLPAMNDAHLVMRFTEPVLIEGITSRGRYINSSRFFVANFSLKADGEWYNKDFTASNPIRVYTITSSIVVQKLEFRINEIGPKFQPCNVSDAALCFCWELQLVGCAAADNITNVDQSSCSTVVDSGTIAAGAVLLVMGVVLVIIAVIIAVLVLVKPFIPSFTIKGRVGRRTTLVDLQNTDLYTKSISQDDHHSDEMAANPLYNKMSETTLTIPPEYDPVNFESQDGQQVQPTVNDEDSKNNHSTSDCGIVNRSNPMQTTPNTMPVACDEEDRPCESNREEETDTAEYETINIYAHDTYSQ